MYIVHSAYGAGYNVYTFCVRCRVQCIYILTRVYCGCGDFLHETAKDKTTHKKPQDTSLQRKCKLRYKIQSRSLLPVVFYKGKAHNVRWDSCYWPKSAGGLRSIVTLVTGSARGLPGRQWSHVTSWRASVWKAAWEYERM